MAKQDFFSQNEYRTYLVNLSEFAKKYSLPFVDLNIVDLTLEILPDIEDKVLKLKDKPDVTIESVLTEEEFKEFMRYLSRALKIYNKKFNLMASKILFEKGALEVFYADFTVKKDFARKLFNMNKDDYDKIAKLENNIFVNLNTVSDILGIKQEDFQLLMDRSIQYWNENFKKKK